MPTNPVEAIERAELLAEKLVLEAGSKRLEILRSAQEEAGQYSVNALNQAERTAEDILQSARVESRSKQQQAHQSLEVQLQALRSRGKQRQDRAVEEVLKLLPTLL